MSWKEFVNSCNLTAKSGSSRCCQTKYLYCQRKQEDWSEWAWLECAECTWQKSGQCSARSRAVSCTLTAWVERDKLKRKPGHVHNMGLCPSSHFLQGKD